MFVAVFLRASPRYFVALLWFPYASSLSKSPHVCISAGTPFDQSFPAPRRLPPDVALQNIRPSYYCPCGVLPIVSTTFPTMPSFWESTVPAVAAILRNFSTTRLLTPPSLSSSPSLVIVTIGWRNYKDTSFSFLLCPRFPSQLALLVLPSCASSFSRCRLPVLPVSSYPSLLLSFSAFQRSSSPPSSWYALLSLGFWNLLSRPAPVPYRNQMICAIDKG